MVPFYLGLCRIGINVAHKVRRYAHLFVALELVSDVEGVILKRIHVASRNNELIRLRRISAFLFSIGFGVQSEGSL